MGKVLTYSHAGYAYVSSGAYDSDYSQWKLTDGTNRSYTPPKSIYAYHDSSAGSAQTQYAFDKDPDSALPSGATYFATRVPGGPSSYPGSNAFVRGGAQEQQQAADWLNRNNAALLFKDGFYLTATGEHTLELRNLQGNTVRTIQINSGPDGDASDIKSDYSVSDQTWVRLQREQDNRERFEEQRTKSDAST